MRILGSLLLSSLSLSAAVHPKYKQHGSMVEKSKRKEAKTREFGNAIMKILPKDSSELSFKIGTNDDDIRIAFASDNDDLEYSITESKGKFKKLKQLEDEGSPGAHDRQDVGKGKSVDAQGIKYKREKSEAGFLKVKAKVKLEAKIHT
jgi:hypothetical protein